MKFAAIDLGTQTFRLALAKVGEKGVVVPMGTYLYNARLGNSLLDGRLGPEVTKGLQEIRASVESHKPANVSACGTEAVRRLRERFTEAFSELSNILGEKVRVLTPEEEGWLTSLGVKTSLGSLQPELLILDVGGGSTEAIFCSSSETIVRSIPIGAVNFNKDGLKALSSLSTPPFSRAEEVVATGGTATTLGSMLKGLSSYRPDEIRGMCVEMDEIEHLITRLASMSLEERRRIPGLEPERADIIIPGLEILLNAGRYIGAMSVTISDGGLLMGILVDLIKKEFKDHAQLDWQRLYI